ncbi:MAG: trypsin-like peptidase domain-containing protein [Gammaproteobacteria bacterium]|nr:trypsin-like peptidase domain-containing protein [Gammaproteobacteria bacterium]MBT4493019.1 trypsin-like peptidase domain-containing protein [Gammaproteobacteria bacterium]MBT7372170.1 trypsin-like peptidase domain-containing protein [Gammaproteobacteria bacterium]
MSAECQSQDDLLTIKFAAKSQLRTTLNWINSKSDLIYSGDQHLEHESEILDLDGVDMVDDSRLGGDPYSALGKLFYTRGEEPGQIGSCTASFLGSPDTLLTAAHCVMSEVGVWNTNFIFVSPYGVDGAEMYSVNCIALPKKWGSLLGENALQTDFAVLQVNRPTSSRPLEFQPLMPKKLRVVGFSDHCCSGKHLVELEVNEYEVFEFGLSLRLDNNPMGEGSSGSPWIDSESGKVVSVSSHYHDGRNLKIDGPKIGKRLDRIVRYAHQGCND